MRVLMAVDGSRESLHAVEFFSHMPFPSGTSAIVATALVDSQFDYVASETGVKLREAEHEAACQAFAEAEKILAQKGITAKHIVEVNHPKRLLMEVAEKEDVDLVVIGARGHSTVHRALLGSTADYVANHAQCPVLVVRPSDNGSDEGSQGSKAPSRLLVAYDGSPLASAALKQASSLKWPSGTDIKVAMLLERPKLIPDDVIYDADMLRSKQAELAKLIEPLCKECNYSYLVKETLHVGSALSSMAIKDDIDLLFIGGTGKSAIASFLLGSESRYVLHHAPCSVWIGREKKA